MRSSQGSVLNIKTLYCLCISVIYPELWRKLWQLKTLFFFVVVVFVVLSIESRDLEMPGKHTNTNPGSLCW